MAIGVHPLTSTALDRTQAACETRNWSNQQHHRSFKSTQIPARMRKHPRQERSIHMVQSIRQAAVLVFQNQTASGDALMQDIAARAGASLGSVYQYYANMESVIAAVYEDVLTYTLEKQFRSAGSYEAAKMACQRKLCALDTLFQRQLYRSFYHQLLVDSTSVAAVKRQLTDPLSSFIAPTDYGL